MNSDAASKKMTYTVKDSSVATVNANGKITALKKGTTTVTVKTFNGKTATCKIIVR